VSRTGLPARRHHGLGGRGQVGNPSWPGIPSCSPASPESRSVTEGSASATGSGHLEGDSGRRPSGIQLPQLHQPRLHIRVHLMGRHQRGRLRPVGQTVKAPVGVSGQPAVLCRLTPIFAAAAVTERPSSRRTVLLSRTQCSASGSNDAVSCWRATLAPPGHAEGASNPSRLPTGVHREVAPLVS
jgi:hypothetical protein